MDHCRRLVSIGMPVYNGGAYLGQALDSLLAQDYTDIEIVVSDNASTDETREICERYAQRDTRIRYVRSAQNLGQMRNFRRALELSTGEYFMWAAHDDSRSSSYITFLAERLDANPDAVLATPRTVYRMRDDSPADFPEDRCAPGASPIETLAVLLDDRSTSWIYGLYRREWLLEKLTELEGYPVWGGDILWLSSVSLRSPIVGSPDAVIYKRVGHHSQRPITPRQILAFYARMLLTYTWISLRYGRSLAQKLVALRLSWKYFTLGYIKPRGFRGMAMLVYFALGFRGIPAESPIRRIYTRNAGNEPH